MSHNQDRREAEGASQGRKTVSDDGKGADPRRTDSGVGGRLVEAFARQLGGQVERASGNEGTIVCLTLPSRERDAHRQADEGERT